MFTAPPTIGESLPVSTIEAGDSQPSSIPCDNAIRFTACVKTYYMHTWSQKDTKNSLTQRYRQILIFNVRECVRANVFFAAATFAAEYTGTLHGVYC